MRYNEVGDLAAGVGFLNVNKVSVGSGFFLCWRDKDRFLANAPGPDGIFRLYQYQRANNWQRDVQALDNRGATRGGGGRGNYAIFLATQPTKTVYGEFNGAPMPLPLSVLDGSDDGRLLYISDDFLSMVLLHADGSSRAFATGPHVNLSSVALTEDGFIYMDQSREHTLMLQQHDAEPVPVALMDAGFDPTSFVYNGTRWLFYHNEKTWLHPVGSTMGYSFVGSYGPSIYVEPNGTAHVALTNSPGEAAETITLVAPFKLGEGMKDLKTTIIMPTFKKFNHPVLIVPFKDPDGVSGARAEIVVNGNNQKANRPYFAGSDSLGGTLIGKLLGIYEETKDIAAIAATLKAARARKTRVAYCFDTTDDPIVPAGFKPWDQPWLELYRYKFETLAQSVARWMRQAQQLLAEWSGDLGVVPMFYCMGGPADDDPNTPPEVWTVQEVLDALAHVADIVNLSSRFKVVAPFEFLRANAITAHAELHDAFNTFLTLTPGDPTFIEVGDIMTGTVTISSYTPSSAAAPARVLAVAETSGDVKQLEWRYRQLGSSTWLRASVQQLTNLSFTYVFADVGTYEISLRGLDATGAPVPNAETLRQRLVIVTAAIPDDVSTLLSRIEGDVAALRSALGK